MRAGVLAELEQAHAQNGPLLIISEISCTSPPACSADLRRNGLACWDRGAVMSTTVNDPQERRRRSP